MTLLINGSIQPSTTIPKREMKARSLSDRILQFASEACGWEAHPVNSYIVIAKDGTVCTCVMRYYGLRIKY